MPSRRSWFARTCLAVGLGLGLVTIVLAHDMFLKPDPYYVAENSEVLVRLLNGTFSKSENSVVKSRIADGSIVSPSGRRALDLGGWQDGGDTAHIQIKTGAAGTYLVGISTRPSTIRLTAKQFNEYLSTDGIPDVLAERRQAKKLDQPAHERYSKHVKALLQVGDAPSDGYQTTLGYPAELVALSNPYAAGARRLELRALVDGQPVPNQLVRIGGRSPSGARIAVRQVRTDDGGNLTIPLAPKGTWYAIFIHMAPVVGDSVNYESKWASLTWQVK